MELTLHSAQILYVPYRYRSDLPVSQIAPVEWGEPEIGTSSILVETPFLMIRVE
jgi:hypothetical protein